jgi:hypothetical protein
MISKQAATGFSGIGNMKAEVIQEATQHCTAAGKKASITKYTESPPPYIFGNYPRVELEFTCQA